MTQITDETYEATIRRPWPTPTCAQCAGQCEAGKPCPIPTDFGDLDEDKRSTEGMGRLLLLAFGVVCLLAALVIALSTGPKQ